MTHNTKLPSMQALWRQAHGGGLKEALRAPSSRSRRFVRPLSALLTMILVVFAGGPGLTPTLWGAAHTQAAVAGTASKTLIVARTLDDMKTLDPGRYFEFSSEAVASNVYDPLVTFNGTDMTHPVGVLATHWTVKNNGTLYTFALRRNVRFSTGRHMTAADVVFSYRRLGHLADNPSFLMGFGIAPNNGIYGVRALGTYTVQFRLPAPDYSFLAQLVAPNFGVLDRIAARQHGATDGANAAKTDRATNWLNEHSIGTGPFKLQRWTHGSTATVVLARNPYYWGRKPTLNRIVFKGVKSPVAQRLQVQNGTVDIAQSIDSEGVKALRGNPNVRIVTGRSFDLVYLGMTLDNAISAPLSKATVRQAVRHAIDYNAIIKKLLNGYGVQTNGMIPVGLIGNSPAQNNKLKPSYNPALARNLLKQAGYPHGFSVDLYYGAGHVVDGVSMDRLMPLIQGYLKAVGINATLKPEDLSTMLSAYRAHKLPMVAMEFVADYPDPSEFAGQASPGGGLAARMQYLHNPALENLVAQSVRIRDKAERAQAYVQIQKIWLKESAFAPIVQPDNVVVLHRGVSGYVYSPLYVQGKVAWVHKS